MSSVLYIFLGLFIISLVYFLVVWSLTSFYFRIVHEKVAMIKSLQISVILAAVGIVSTMICMIAFSAMHIYTLAILLSILSAAAYFTTLKYLWKFTNFDSAIISITLAIILNPTWLHLLGVM